MQPSIPAWIFQPRWIPGSVHGQRPKDGSVLNAMMGCVANSSVVKDGSRRNPTEPGPPEAWEEWLMLGKSSPFMATLFILIQVNEIW